MQATDEAPCAIIEEDALRVQAYGLLARLLAEPPSAEFITRVAALEGDASAFGLALNELAAAARDASAEALAEEYHALFIGLAGGELTPYGSYYLTGFLFEKPLAELRADLARLGIVRQEQRTKDPEDHIAMLCEAMAGLIAGAFGEGPAALAEQRAFFDRHLGSWARQFFADLEAAEAARFYRPVGKIGRHFMEIERQAFAMAA
ncbi:MAG TPA: molecular chaperone TorD family protein [Alphaproteobacteria bacterium]|nr:molecular chaperone TorD family protein [Alphaproteobacteria bacterium]